MSNNTPNPHVRFADDGNVTFLIRWRGKQEGPYTATVIEAKLDANQIGLLHEVFHDGQWVTIRDYLGEQEAVQLAERRAREEQDRLAREKAEGRKEEVDPNSDRPTTISLVDSPLTRRAVRGLIIVACVCGSLWFVTALVSMVSVSKERANPAIRQSTKSAWRDLQLAEAQPSPSGIKTASKYYERIALQLSQIDADDADAELKNFIRNRLQAAKNLATIWQQIEQELEKSHAGREEFARFVEAFGILLGAVANNGRSAGENMQIGQFAGRLSGASAAVFLKDTSDKNITARFGGPLKSASDEFDQLSRFRPQLGERLGKKYNLQLLDAF